MSQALARIGSAQKLVVTQQKEWGEIITGWETKNRYLVSAEDGDGLMYAGEVGGGGMEFLMRSFLKNKRPFKIELRDTGGQVVITIERPFTWFFSRAQIIDASGTVIGTIQQRFAWLNRRFVISDRKGHEVGFLTGSLFHPWTFPLEIGGQPSGQITKKWSGLLKEAFTDADTFGVEFSSTLAQELRLVALGATFLLDFLYFENRD